VRGASEVPLYSSDIVYPEYQEAYFYYLCGVIEMDCYLLLDLHNNDATLFIPKLDNLYKIWMNFLTKEQAANKYDLKVEYTEDLESKMS
jgi:hypothetical protein